VVEPYNDGTAFSFVTGYRGQVYVGPSASGTSALRMASPVAAPEPLSFLFARDITGTSTKNTNPGPYTSIGADGCITNTAACGPDNENQRGQFTSFAIGGTEWLIASGAKATKGATYLYMTTDTDAVLDFRYVDLNTLVVPGNTYGVSALGAVGSRLYVGTAGISASRAKLFGLSVMPSAPGLDATSDELADMRLERIAAWTEVPESQNVDAIASIGGIAYVANPSAWVRANTASPAPVSAPCTTAVCGDWSTITPSAPAYAARPSRVTTKGGQLEPADRAVVQIVPFGDRIFVARNTTTGPQLWSCRPIGSMCDAGDWNLVAANTTGDPLLTQFDDPSLTSVSMLVATASYLYVGFDSTGGVRVLRTANPAAAAATEFDTVSDAGLGTPTNTSTRIFDAKAIVTSGATAVWLTIGNLTSPLSLVVIP
jgi:hypothetical protein